MLQLTLLPQFSVIEATGEEVSLFLQSQLTQDMDLLNTRQATLAAYCSAKGRTYTTMILSDSSDDTHKKVHIVLPSELRDAFLKRIQMFVLRAKVKFQISTLQVYGLALEVNPSTHSFEDPIVQKFINDLPHTAWQQTQQQGTWIMIPTNSEHLRYLALSTPEQLSRLNIISNDPDTDYRFWATQDILAALPWLDSTTTETLIPQSLNLDRLGAISFTKGCYPGQEIVARSHYLGKLKRRMYCVSSSQVLSRHEDVFKLDDLNSACGRILNVAYLNTLYYALIECQVEASTHLLQTQSGASLTLLPLPYTLSDEAN